MCLSVAVHRPTDVLATGKHAGFEWNVVHNGMGHRCGYVRIPKGHPWHGKGFDDIYPDVHGGITFAEADLPCDKGGEDDAWWIGFDCAHCDDAPDPKLPSLESYSPIDFGRGRTVRTQDYVEAECRKLCEQAHLVMIERVK